MLPDWVAGKAIGLAATIEENRAGGVQCATGEKPGVDS
jgi:hypothetical protein